MRCELYRNNLALYDSFEEREIIKNMLGGVFSKREKAWIVPFNIDNVKKIYNTFECEFDDAVKGIYKQKVQCKNIKKAIDDENYIPSVTFEDTISANLMRHQIIGANMALDLFNNGSSGVMFSMEMGTGKTLTAMATLSKLDDVKKVLIVCPKVAMRVWRDEFLKFYKKDYMLRLLIGTAKARVNAMNELIENDEDSSVSIAVINYEYTTSFESILTEWKPDLIICDESHRIKSPSSNQTQSIIKIGTDAKYKLCLTGTPLTNNILDFFSQYKFLDPSIFGGSFTNYKNKYVITGMFNEYLRPNPITKRELTEKVNSIAYRVTKEECLDLPEYKDINIDIDFDPKIMKKYRELENEYITWLNEQTKVTVDNALTKTLRLRQLTGGFIYNEDGESVCVDNAKLNACMEIIHQLMECDKKVVVFAEFVPEILAIAEACNKDGITCGTYYGATSTKNRDALFEDFQNNANGTKVFIGQIESAGISITLTRASYCIFYSTGYKYGVYDQARARIHRKGQTQKCTYFHLLVNGTIDGLIVKALNKKEALAESIVDYYKKV